MALTRSMLKTMGLSEEQIETIISEHTTTTEALKEQRDGFKKERDSARDERDKFKEEADKIPDMKKEIDGLKKDHVSADDWKAKYEDEHKQFEDYKNDIAGKEALSKVHNAYKALLTECKVGDKHIDSIIKVTDFKDLKLKDDGTFENVDALKEQIGKDWSGFITSTGTKGAKVETPPAGGTGSTGGNSRAAELAAKYHENMYGKANKEE